MKELAREAYAKALEAKGPAWANSANSVRAGYENAWVSAGIAAIEEVLRNPPYETDTEGGGAETQDHP